ncbi:MAG: outer membrane protein transport protein [Proteobacteria bacterium]|nr:outer membrane protein transport protein [Pseudomonadota bacterium]
MLMPKNKLLLCIVLILMFTLTCHADETHYINSNVGDRASGMAGAYTAISDDSSGCYYNPAGIAFAPANKFSASVNAISTSTRTYKNVLTDISGNTLDWEQKSFSLLPNYFGIVQTFGPGMVGFSYAVPDSAQMRQKQVFTNIQGAQVIDTYTINLNNYDKAYLFGPSYSYKVSDSLSLGGTLYYYYRDSELIVNQFVMFQDNTEAITNIHSTRTDQGIKPILGVIWDPMDNLSIGLTLSKLWLFDSEKDIQSIQNNYPADAADFFLVKQSLSDKDKFPLSTALGLAWFYSPSLLFSCDLKYFDSVDDKKSVLNIALATEYYTSERFAIRAGIYSDMSNAPDVTSATVSDVDHMDIYGLSLSGSFFSGKSSVSLGVDWGFGKGDAQVDASSNTVYDVEYNNLTLHISTSFSY